MSSMINDVDFLKSRLGRVDGFGDTGDYLNKIIKAKEVKKAEVKEEQPPAPAANGTATEKEDEKAGDASASAEPVKDEEKK